MHIEKVNIQNFKCFGGLFSIPFNDGLNIIVGDNEAGKSTILEAINLAVSGILHGRYLRNELSQYLFNYSVVSKYLNDLKNGLNPGLPSISIEIFFSGDDHPLFEGNGNFEKLKACGLSFKIEFDEEYQVDYQTLLDTGGEITTLPIEYYKVSWKSFARDSITARTIPIKSVLIDSSSNRFQNGSDVYISRIIRNELDDTERVQLSQSYRRMKDGFSAEPSILSINKKISDKAKITNKKLSISVDLSTQNSWETSLMTYMDEIPFHQIGKGEQCIAKTNLALSHDKNRDANLVLIEEPENHLSHTKMSGLIQSLSDRCVGKQVLVSTHSSFVANKLGLNNLVLLNDHKSFPLSELSSDNFTFFKKMPGYQTLRMLLCKKAVLVEGDSDELIYQRAYMDSHDGRLPIEDGVDVISVKLCFKRFLDIAIELNQPVAVITDNDANYLKNITKKYADYKGETNVHIFADTRNSLHTLEPQFVDANRDNLKGLCSAFGINAEKYGSIPRLRAYMRGQKTSWALNVFEYKKKLKYPEYINKAVSWADE